MTTRAVILELLRQVTAVKVQPALPAYTTTWRDYISDLIRRVQITGNLRADLDPRATDGIVIVIVIAMVAGLKTNTPLPDGLGQSAIEQVRPRSPHWTKPDCSSSAAQL